MVENRELHPQISQVRAQWYVCAKGVTGNQGAGELERIKDPCVEEKAIWFTLLSLTCLGPTSDKSSSCKPHVLERKGSTKVAELRASLAFTPDGDLEGKTHQETDSSSDCCECSSASKLLFIWCYSSPVVTGRHKWTGKNHKGEGLSYWKGWLHKFISLAPSSA